MRRPRKLTGRRNLTLVLVFAALFLAAAIGVRFMDRAPVVLLPEWRNLPEVPPEENAVTLLDEARGLLPKVRPMPLVLEDPKQPGRKMFYETEDNSIGRRLRIDRPDNDPELLAFLHQCENAAAKVRESLSRPAWRVPNKPTYRDYRAYRYDLALFACLAGAMGIIEGRYDEAADLLFDLWQVNHRLQLTPGAYGSYDDDVYRELRRLVRSAEAPEFLERVQQRLQALRPVFPSLRIVVEKDFWMLDNTLEAGVPKEGPIPQRAANTYLYVQMRRIARFLQQYKDEIFALTDKPVIEFRRWLEAHPEAADWSAIGVSPFQEISQHLYSAGFAEARLYANILFIACERCRRDNGAYPNTLDELVPKYLEGIENSPLDGKPYLYSVDEGMPRFQVSWWRKGQEQMQDVLPRNER